MRQGVTRTGRRKPAVKITPAPKSPESLAQAASRIAATAPVVISLRADLEEVAIATGAYRRTLIREGIPVEKADLYVDSWQASLWPEIEADEHDEDEPDDELEPA